MKFAAALSIVAFFAMVHDCVGGGGGTPEGRTVKLALAAAQKLITKTNEAIKPLDYKKVADELMADVAAMAAPAGAVAAEVARYAAHLDTLDAQRATAKNAVDTETNEVAAWLRTLRYSLRRKWAPFNTSLDRGLFCRLGRIDAGEALLAAAMQNFRTANKVGATQATLAILAKEVRATAQAAADLMTISRGNADGWVPEMAKIAKEQ